MKLEVCINNKYYLASSANWDTDGDLEQVTYVDEHGAGHVLVHNPAARDLTHAGFTYVDLREVVRFSD